MVAQIFRRSSLDQGFRSYYGVGMENKNEALKALIEEVGGATQLAAVCGVTEGAVRPSNPRAAGPSNPRAAGPDRG